MFKRSFLALAMLATLASSGAALAGDASEVIWEEFDLCAVDKITLKYNRSTGTVSADVE